MHRLTRKQMLAAELYGYSYAHYENHLGIGNIRFDKLMPDDVDIMERAEQEGWDSLRLAQAIEIPEKKIKFWQQKYREAKEIVEAPTSAEAFRRGVRYSIQHAVEEGLTDKPPIERLVTQICYRAADFGFRLNMEKKQLSDYSEELCEETEYDREETERILQEGLEQIKKGAG